MSTPTTFWRLAGMSYTQYVMKSTSTVRAALKGPAKTKAMELEAFSYNAAAWSSGQSQGKNAVDSLAKAGRVA